MQLYQPFDATQFDPSQSAGQLPVGKHPVVIIDSEVKPTTDNQSGLLELTLQIIDGPSKGMTGAYRLNLYNTKSQQAVEIAHKQFSAVCYVIGVFNVKDSQQLHNIPFIVEVALQKNSEAAEKGYTQVVRVYDRNGNEPGKAGAGAPAQTTAPQQPAQGQQPQQWTGAPGAPQQQNAAPQQQWQPPQTGQAPSSQAAPQQQWTGQPQTAPAAPNSGDSRPAWAK